MKVSKNRYLQLFGIVVIVLALFRCAYPRVAMSNAEKARTDSLASSKDTISSVCCPATETTNGATLTTRDIVGNKQALDGLVQAPIDNGQQSAKWLNLPHRINSVPGRWQDNFPDSQSVHLEAAYKWGVKSVANRADAEKRKSELVYVGASPYYCMDDRMKRSIPYLVPRASDLLNDIGRAYFDSLYVKGVPFHKIIITSALRTKEDVEILRTHNGNATENSCHLYGTTVDIAQNRYKTVCDPRTGARRQVQNDTLKWVLAEVLRDFRNQGRCYIKYEMKQGCFHITVK